MDSVPVLAAAAAGVVSFLSPCVLPLVPGYLSFVSGMSYADLAGEGDHPISRAALTRVVTTNGAAFVLGFTTVFVALGASATTLGRFLVGSAAICRGRPGGARRIRMQAPRGRRAHGAVLSHPYRLQGIDHDRPTAQAWRSGRVAATPAAALARAGSVAPCQGGALHAGGRGPVRRLRIRGEWRVGRAGRGVVAGAARFPA